MICLFIIDKLKIILDVNPITLGEGGGVCVCGIHPPQQIKLITVFFTLQTFYFIIWILVLRGYLILAKKKLKRLEGTQGFGQS